MGISNSETVSKTVWMIFVAPIKAIFGKLSKFLKKTETLAVFTLEN